MLILVAVSVTVALNGGLFTKTNEAAKGTEVEAEKERILADYYTYKAKKVEGEEATLSILDATEVTGNETSGWQITLSNGNKYTLSGDGKLESVDPNKKTIDPNWYIPTEEELSSFASSYGMYLVATSDKNNGFGGDQIILYAESEGVYIIDVANHDLNPLREFIYIPNQATADYYAAKAVEDNNDIEVEIGKWYRCESGSGFEGATLYTGSCPVSESDFTENGIILSPTYLQRIIDSFEQ